MKDVFIRLDTFIQSIAFNRFFDKYIKVRNNISMQKQLQMFKKLLILLIGLHVTFAKSLKKTDFGVEVSKNVLHFLWKLFDNFIT